MKYFYRYLKIAPLSHALWRSLEARALEKVKIKRPILDIGCGFGEFAGVFFEKMVEVGIDIDPNELILAGQKKKYKKLVWADACHLPFKKNSFQTIISISTLEHIKNVDKVLAEVKRVLKKRGCFIFSIPTISLNYLLLFPSLFRKFNLRFLADIYLKIFHWAFKHQVIINQKEWLTKLRSKKFKIISLKKTISKKQIIIFELFLPFALITQLFRLIFKKRLPISPDFRVKTLYSLFKNFLDDQPLTDANILVVAQKI